jgi:hypothetical protein
VHRYTEGRRRALAITAVLFGLSHFNKRSALFNWRYVVLASVDAIWSFWF